MYMPEAIISWNFPFKCGKCNETDTRFLPLAFSRPCSKTLTEIKLRTVNNKLSQSFIV
jgi:hypothetical protein